MNFKKTAISAAVVAGIGLGAAAAPTTASAVLADGAWTLAILPTATKTTTYGGTGFKFGKDGKWQSSFTFGTLPGQGSNGMTDNDTKVTDNVGTHGSGIVDGYAGMIALTVSGGNISVAGTQITGSVDASGNMTLTPTGRKGHINSPLMEADWNIDDFSLDASGNPVSNGNTNWQSFSTGSATAAKGTINGAALTDVGDLDGDGINDFSGVLVSGGQVGSGWGSFFGATYYEAWRVNILSGTAASANFSVDTIFATAGGDFAQTAAVPVPAAVWLFGSGLLGLVGVARRKKA